MRPSYYYYIVVIGLVVVCGFVWFGFCVCGFGFVCLLISWWWVGNVWVWG